MNGANRDSGWVTTEEHGGVIVIRMNRPPVNSIGLHFRQELHREVSHAINQASEGIVLCGSGRGFSAGADIREFATDAATTSPTLAELIALLEGSPVPVVAALHGYALGGGLELALGCRYRLAARDTTLGLPETQLGVVPGAGGTQRLPRITTMDTAIRVIVDGVKLNAGEALRAGIVDELFTGEAGAAGVRFIHSISGPGHASVTKDIDREAGRAAIAQAHAELPVRARNLRAQRAALDCLSDALALSLPAGLVAERRRFEELVRSSEAKALRHLFFAERQSAKLPVAALGLAPVSRAAVVGGGTMGTGIATALLDAGIRTTLVDQNSEAVARAADVIARGYERRIDRGRMSTTEKEERLALLDVTTEVSACEHAEFIVEAVYEDIAVKREVLLQLEEVIGAEVILATNTSRLSVDDIATSLNAPDRVVGTHFFSPAQTMPLLEVVEGAQTSALTLTRTLAFGVQLGKKPVVVGVAEGFVGNRMLTPYWREAWSMLEEGATAAQIDAALVEFGMAMGPLAMADLAGLDINWAARKRLAPTRDPSHRYPLMADRLCEAGRFGQKRGAGFYRYEPGSRTPIPDPEVDRIARECAAEQGITRRNVAAEEIVERCMLALINEGAKVLDEGVARRSSDIDVIYVNGYGFPAERGGPMFAAEEWGLAKVLESVSRLRAQFGPEWAPAAYLERLVAAGAARFDQDPEHRRAPGGGVHGKVRV